MRFKLDAAARTRSLNPIEDRRRSRRRLTWGPTVETLEQRRVLDGDDTISGAVSLGAAGTLIELGGTIDPRIDVDFYKFTATAGQVVEIDIDLPTPGLDTQLRLWRDVAGSLYYEAADDDGNAPGESSNTDEAYFRFTAETGTYYVGVSAWDNYLYDPVTGDLRNPGREIGPYVIRLSATSAAPANPDPNDEIDEAQDMGAIAPTRSINGTLDNATDVDMYKFTVTAPGWVSFDIDADTALDSFLRVFGANGSVIYPKDPRYLAGGAQDGNGPGETTARPLNSYFEYQFTQAGTYYVAVSSSPNYAYSPVTGNGDVAGTTTGTYTLTVLAIDNLQDSNDQTIEAPAIQVSKGKLQPIKNLRTLSGSVERSIDVDLYKFTATKGQILLFTIRSVGDPKQYRYTATLWMRLFDSRGVQLRDSAPFGLTMRHKFAKAGTYYVGVSYVSNNLYDPLTGARDSGYEYWSNNDLDSSYRMTVGPSKTAKARGVKAKVFETGAEVSHGIGADRAFVAGSLLKPGFPAKRR